MSEPESLISPVRGVNPEPDSGWPWHLTEYEIAYIQTFNARPVRESNWPGTQSDEERLDLEAEGVRAALRTSRRRVKLSGKRWPWVTWIVVGAAVLVASCTVTALNIVNLLDLQAQIADLNWSLGNE